jgi:hypothetical protein
MNRLDRFSSNASNAVIELDCPWCAEPVRTTDAELADGLACSACLVVIQLDPEPTSVITAPVPIAA